MRVRFPKPISIFFPFLVETTDPDQIQENNWYPFVFLNLDGHFFIFVNNRAVLLDYKNNKIVKHFLEILGGDPKSYPSTSLAVLLPLKIDSMEAEILVCGEAPKGSFLQAKKGMFVRVFFVTYSILTGVILQI